MSKSWERALLCAALLPALLAGCGRPTPTAAPPMSPTAVAAAPTATPQAPTSTRPPTATPAAPSPTPPPPGPTATLEPEQVELLEAMAAIGAEMEILRDLDATQPISHSVMSRAELADYLIDDLNREYTPEEAEADVRVLAAFDSIPEDYDLRRVLLDLYTSQILGLYDDERDTLYVVSDTGLDLLARITLAHEFTHGLQDEHFDLETFLDEERMSGDQILARQALIEGDASLAMTQYVMAHLSEITEEDVASLQAEESEAGTANLPPIIRDTFEFPYIYGEPFVTALQQQGWDAVDAAYADPPSSTEQILHPEKYLAGDEPQLVPVAPLTDTLGSGWRLADADTWGEFQTSLYLGQQVDEETAAAASQGWDGDRYAVYVNGDDEVLVLVTAWDSPADREEFVSAYADYGRAKYGQAGRRDGDVLTWGSPSQAAYLGWNEATTVIVLGPDQGIVDRVVAAIKADWV